MPHFVFRAEEVLSTTLNFTNCYQVDDISLFQQCMEPQRTCVFEECEVVDEKIDKQDNIDIKPLEHPSFSVPISGKGFPAYYQSKRVSDHQFSNTDVLEIGTIRRNEIEHYSLLFQMNPSC